MSTVQSLMAAQSASTPSPQQATTGFFSLPGELRNKIYRYLLLFTPEDHEVINVRRKPSKPTPPGLSFDNLSGEIDLTILRTSKAVHEEASSIFYGENRFLTHVRPSGYDDEENVLPREIIAADYWRQMQKISVLISSDKGNKDERDVLTDKVFHLAATIYKIPRLNELRVFINDVSIYYTFRVGRYQSDPAVSAAWFFMPLKNVANNDGGIQYFDMTRLPIEIGEAGDEHYVMPRRETRRHPMGFPKITEQQLATERLEAFEKEMGKPLLLGNQYVAYRFVAHAQHQATKTRAYLAWRARSTSGVYAEGD